MSSPGSLVPLVDLASWLLAPFAIHALHRAFDQPRLLNGVWPALAYLGFCLTLYLARRLPYEKRASPHHPEATSPRGVFGLFAATSIMVGTVLLLFAVPWVAGGAARSVFAFFHASSAGEALGFAAGCVALALIMLPLHLLWQPKATPIGRHVRYAELTVAALGDTVLVVMTALWEWVLAAASTGTEDESNWVAIIAFAVIMPIPHLLIFGGPRLLLLSRRFSWGALAMLYATTGWYFAGGFLW